MLKSIFDAVMERRALQLLEQIRPWLPSRGPVLDLGSGTGHLAARLERECGLEMITADVTDMHVAGRPPVLIHDALLPFEEETFSATLLCFMLAYPSDAAAALSEAARVTRGPVILVQSVSCGLIGRAWHLGREFIWTVVAFNLSRLLGYVPPGAGFSMNARRYYSADALEREVMRAGLRIRGRRERPVLPGRALVVAAWNLERHDPRDTVETIEAPGPVEERTSILTSHAQPS